MMDSFFLYKLKLLKIQCINDLSDWLTAYKRNVCIVDVGLQKSVPEKGRLYLLSYTNPTHNIKYLFSRAMGMLLKHF